MKGRILMLALLAMVFGCDADKREVNQKAKFLCENDFSEKVTLQVWPSDKAIEQYVIAPDIMALRADDLAITNNPFAGLLGGLLNSFKAAHEATVGTITCDVEKTTVQGASATVTLAIRSKRLADVETNVFPKLADLPDHTAKVAYMKTLLKAGEYRNESKDLEFRKVNGAWLVDYGIAAKKEAEAAQKAADDLREEQLKKLNNHANDLFEKREWKAARDAFNEIKTLDPNFPDVDASIASAQDMLDHTIGGKWYLTEEKDAMTDELSTYLSMLSDEKTGTFGTEYAVITLRCVRGKLESFVSLKQMIDRDWRTQTTPVKIRFDAEKPIPMRLGTNTGHDAIFMKSSFLDLLGSHPNTKLAIEYAPYGSGPVVTTFQTAGADLAVAHVQNACKK